MVDLRFAVFGTGFWSHYQIPAWFEVGGVELAALYNRTVSKAEAVAELYGVPSVYGDPEELLRSEKLDFIDIITEAPAHEPLVLLAAQYGIPVICQKPMAGDYAACQRMVRACDDAGVPFYVHENYRWQAPIRELKRIVDEGRIGQLFRGRFQFLHALEPFVWENQPLLKSLSKLIIADQGSHQLDLARFFFGEFRQIHCQHLRVRDDIVAEDVASISLRSDEAIVNVELSFVTQTEWKHFPETFVFLEGTEGTLELGPDFWVRLTTDAGTRIHRCPPPRYAWADPDYGLNHASMPPLHENFLRGLRGGQPPENTGADNLKTMQLVYAAYESAERNEVVSIDWS